MSVLVLKDQNGEYIEKRMKAVIKWNIENNNIIGMDDFNDVEELEEMEENGLALGEFIVMEDIEPFM